MADPGGFGFRARRAGDNLVFPPPAMLAYLAPEDSTMIVCERTGTSITHTFRRAAVRLRN